MDRNKHFLETLQYDPTFPVTSRVGARSVIGTLNAVIISNIRAHMMAERFGVVPESLRQDGEERFEQPHPSVDSRNRQDAEKVGEQLRDESRHEQGFALREKPLVIAGRAKLVRDALDKMLHEHAGERELLSGQRIPDPMHVGQPLEGTLDFMAGLTAGGRAEEIVLDPDLASLGITLEDMKRAASARGDRQRAFLRNNREEIIAIYKGLIPSDHDGFVLSPEQWLTVFDKLPAYQRMSCLASCDRALYRAFLDQVENHRRGSLMAMGNIVVLQDHRRWIRAEAKEWYSDVKFADEYREQVARANGREPQFEVAPPPATVKGEPQRRAA